jgi:NAD(P)-dependent dehydrogenase (short-subunit alcohol dehydrogenase family)
MQIERATAIVTGANRGLGRAIARALVEREARTVYGGARDSEQIVDPGVTPIQLDITDHADITAATQRCSEATLLVNNAGIAANTQLVNGSMQDARALMETNYFGTLDMCQSFAPILARNGGGGIVNVLSIVSFMSVPGMGAFCTTKAALWSLTNGVRMEVRAHHTHVMAVHSTFIDTDLSSGLDVPKLSPTEVADAILDALVEGREEILLGERTRMCKDALPNDLQLIYPDLERQWHARP